MVYRFGDCELDETRSELRRAGRPVTIQPKPLALLAYLLANRERLVPKDELLDALWPDTAVTESSLTRAVSIARKAIGDQGRGRIRSISRRGYRFVGDVSEGGDRRVGLDPVVAAPSGEPSGEAFVGREGGLASLRAAWRQAQSGEGRIALIAGEPGIGKSRLAEVFARTVAEEGGWVCRARSDDNEGAPAFWLWVQILRDLAGHTDLAEVASRIGAPVAEVAHLVPQLAGVDAGGGPDREHLSPEQGRFLFFDAVTRLLTAASEAEPILVFLDDLQWAGKSSLLLLEHLAPVLRHHRMLVIATVREESRPHGHPLDRTRSQLSQQDHVTTTVLAGFTRVEVAALLEHALGRPPPETLVQALLDRTEGNPLFVREAMRLLADRDQLRHPEIAPDFALDQLPERTRDVVRRNLHALSEACMELLSVGSVLGRDFRLPLIAAVADLPRAGVLDLLDEAVRAGAVEEVTQPAGTFRFAHPLFQEVTYADLPPGRRARLHERARDALEKQNQGARELILAELAHHAHLGLSAGDPDLAYRTALEAAERATEVLAYEQAARHYEQALAALEQEAAPDPVRRLRTLLVLGAAHRFAGDRTRRREVLGQALEEARAADREAEFVAAAIGFCDMSEWAPRDEEGEAILREALERVPEAAGGQRVRLMTRLAYLSRRYRNRSEALAREALALARQLDDPDALQEALYTLHLILSGVACFEERTSLVNEMCDVAPQGSYQDLAFIGLVDLASDRVSQGDIAGAREMRAGAAALAGENPHRGLVWHLQLYDAGMALLEGRFDEAEPLIRETFRVGQTIEHPYAALMFAAQTLYLLRDRGGPAADTSRLGDLRAAGRSVHLGPALLSVMSNTAAREGRVEEAREGIGELRGEGFAKLPHHSDWSTTMVHLSEAVATLRDEALAEELLALIEPFDHAHAVLPVPVCYDGPLTRACGLLEAARGELAAAEERLQQALEQSERLGARPMCARIRIELGSLVQRRGRARPGEALLREGLAAARELGMADQVALAEAALGEA